MNYGMNVVHYITLKLHLRPLILLDVHHRASELSPFHPERLWSLIHFPLSIPPSLPPSLPPQIIHSVSTPSICKLSCHPVPHMCYPLLSSLPAPLDLLPFSRSRDLVPWKHFLFTCGSYPGSLPHCWEVGSYVYTSLAMLSPNER